MTPKQVVRTAGAVAAIVAIVLAGMLITSPRVQANEDNGNESRIQQGFDIAPVHLNLAGKNPALVGLGSYLVNGVTPCNDCHSAGPATQFAPGGNPYFDHQPKMVNAATYLGGGRDLGLLPMSGAAAPHIVSRNLTPDKTGLPVGGLTFTEFVHIMRTGADLDHVHPNCSATVTTHCLTQPYNGDLLQVMPWPTFQNMTDHDLRAIYEYLSAIPCIDNTTSKPPDGFPNELRNDCQ